MLVVVFILISGLVIFGYFLSRKKAIKDFNTAYNSINLGTGVYLIKKYREKYNKETAAKLGAAVTNKIFGNDPSNEDGREFLKQESNLINEEFSSLKNEDILCKYISIAIHMKVINSNRRKVIDQMFYWLIDLQNSGIVLPLEKISMPKNSTEFLKVSDTFLDYLNEKIAV